MIFEIGLGMCLPDGATWADARDSRPASCAPACRRGDLVPALLRARRRLRRGRRRARGRCARDGGDWIINGQKVWTSGAHFCDYGIVITRSDLGQAQAQGPDHVHRRHEGDPGVEVRPIHQMSGGSGFNEVFFTDVRIPDSQRLGAVRRLEGDAEHADERASRRSAATCPPGWSDLMEACTQQSELDGRPAIERPPACARSIADWYVQQQGLKLTRNRGLTALSKGQTPGPEMSIGKLVAPQP
jgi:alkylation response protein AidB-like acyl-CoA dehydrogenase